MQKSLAAYLAVPLLFVIQFAIAATPQGKGLNAIQALSTYPAAVRQATAEVLGYPGLLVQLAQTATKTRSQFQTLLKAYPESTQKELWQLLRYPKLLRELTAFGPQDEKALKTTISSYPKELEQPALDLTKNHFDLLSKTEDLHRQALQEFSQTMKSAPPAAQSAFRTVGQHSEILHILAQNLKLAEITPESFKKNPGPLTEQTKAMAQKIQNAPVEAHPVNIQAGSQDDPQAVATLRKAAENFESQNDYAFDQEPFTAKGAAQASVSYTPYNSVFTPIGWAYPFWFGWPAWDPYPYL